LLVFSLTYVDVDIFINKESFIFITFYIAAWIPTMVSLVLMLCYFLINIRVMLTCVFMTHVKDYTYNKNWLRKTHFKILKNKLTQLKDQNMCLSLLKSKGLCNATPWRWYRDPFRITSTQFKIGKTFELDERYHTIET